MNPAGRTALAAVFVWAAASRVLAWHGSVESLRDYRILPAGLLHPAAVAIPIVELVLAGALLAGRATRPAAVLAGVVLVAFVAATAVAWARGLPLSCGCPAGPVHTAGGYLGVLLRNGALFAVAALLAVFPAGRRRGREPQSYGATSPSTRTPGTNQSS